jgi:hypothetical protein
LKLTQSAISLDEFNANNAAASIKDEALDDFGFGLRLESSCHGERRKRTGSRP